MRLKRMLLLLSILLLTGCGKQEDKEVESSVTLDIVGKQVNKLVQERVTPEPIPTPEPTPEPPPVPTCEGARGIRTEDFTAMYVGDDNLYMYTTDTFTFCQNSSQAWFKNDKKRYTCDLESRVVFLSVPLPMEDFDEIMTIYSHLKWEYIEDVDGKLVYHDKELTVDENGRLLRAGDFEFLYDEEGEVPSEEGYYKVDWWVIDDAVEEELQ